MNIKAQLKPITRWRGAATYLGHDAGQVAPRGFHAGPLVARQTLHLGATEAHVQLAAQDAHRGRHRALPHAQRSSLQYSSLLASKRPVPRRIVCFF